MNPSIKMTMSWYSHRLEQEVGFGRWGWFGQPVLLYPTAGGDFEECERFLMMDALSPLIESGRIKVYSCDSVGGAAMMKRGATPAESARIQNLFDAYVYHEVVPAIRQDCQSSEIEIVTAGASIGAFNAVAALCRHPDVFRTAIAMSGAYDLSRWLAGGSGAGADFHFASPLHFLPALQEGQQLQQLRERMIIMPTGEGRWEDPGESWRMAQVLGACGIPNRVDPWGTEWDHDWMTWRKMLPQYLAAES